MLGVRDVVRDATRDAARDAVRDGKLEGLDFAGPPPAPLSSVASAAVAAIAADDYCCCCFFNPTAHARRNQVAGRADVVILGMLSLGMTMYGGFCNIAWGRIVTTCK